MPGEEPKSGGPFSESLNSNAIFNYFNAKFGQLIAPVGLAKACSVVSAKLKGLPAANIFLVAPARQFKSRTSFDVQTIFPKQYYYSAGSDFTIHGFYEDTKGKSMKMCVLVNDFTLLMTGKRGYTRERLISGLAELLADGEYQYKDFARQFTMKGHLSCICNMTLEAYQVYQHELFLTTFIERFLTLFFCMPVLEQVHYLGHRQELSFGPKITITKQEIENEKDYRMLFIEEGKIWSAHSLKSLIGCTDLVTAIARAHVCLNGRNRYGEDDLLFLKMLRDYLSNPLYPDEVKIVEYLRQKRTHGDICLLLGKPFAYAKVVAIVERIAKERGLI